MPIILLLTSVACVLVDGVAKGPTARLVEAQPEAARGPVSGAVPGPAQGVICISSDEEHSEPVAAKLKKRPRRKCRDVPRSQKLRKVSAQAS